MKVTALMVGLAMAMFAVAAPAVAADLTKITGVVVDPSCYLKGMSTGQDHKMCAIACNKGGVTLGIVTDDGKLYTAMPNKPGEDPDDAIFEHIAHKVTVTGAVAEKGEARGITIKSVEMAQ